MIIPCTFKISGRTYTVAQMVQTSKHHPLGRLNPAIKFITIYVDQDFRKRRDKHIAETFWHEVTHAILHDMQHPLWRDEKFVTAFSKRLNEVVHTAKLP